MEATRIYEHDSYIEIAEKIYKQFVVGQFCTVTGFLQVGTGVEAKGQMVLQSIEQMDIRHNMMIGKDKRPRRKRVKLPNTIGDHVAQKTFRWEKRRDDNELKVTIWRIQ